MKKSIAFTACAALTVASAFAFDATANIKLRGAVMSAEKTKGADTPDFAFLTNEPKDQKDDPDDAIEIDVDGGLAGAHIALWYNTATKEDDGSADDAWAAYFRRTYVWFKPVDTFTVRAGYVGNDTFFKEKIDEWKVGSPFAIKARTWGGYSSATYSDHPAYINCNDVEGWGFGVEYRPIDQLVFNAGIAPGPKGSIESSNPKSASITYTKGDEKAWVAPWGAGVKYYWNTFEFQASYRSGGRDTTTKNPTWSVARFGAGYKDNGLEAFFQPILGFDYNKKKGKTELTGVCADLYGEWSLDAWKFQMHLPVTFRFTDDDDDVNYLEWVTVIKYNTGSHGNLDDLTPYFRFGSNWSDAAYDPLYRAWLLDSHLDNSLNATFQPGVNFKVGACEVDLGVQIERFSDYHKATYNKDWAVSVPFSMEISY